MALSHSALQPLRVTINSRKVPVRALQALESRALAEAPQCTMTS